MPVPYVLRRHGRIGDESLQREARGTSPRIVTDPLALVCTGVFDDLRIVMSTARRCVSVESARARRLLDGFALGGSCRGRGKGRGKRRACYAHGQGELFATL